jgi:hypothetical protein
MKSIIKSENSGCFFCGRRPTETHHCMHGTAKLNLQDGSGYYIPDMEDETDKAELKKFVKQEESRLKSIGWALKAARSLERAVCD